MDNYLVEIIQHAPYAGLLFVLLLAGLGVPIPEDIPLLTAGWLVHRGEASLVPMTLTGLFGVIAGDSLMFYFGWKWGDRAFEHRWLRRVAKPALVEKARVAFARHGSKILVAARFMPGLRAVVFLSAGALRVPYWKFLLFDGGAALFSVPVWVIGGYYVGGKIEVLFEGARHATWIGIGVLFVVLIGAVFFERWMGRRGAREPEGPLSPGPTPPAQPAEPS